MGVKLARALGAHVVAFTTAERRRADALRLGAQEVVVWRNPEEMNAQAGKLDFILRTVAVPHSLDTYLALLPHGAENGVVAETETIPMQEIETAFARMVKNDLKYRFVVDMKSLKRNH
jgi:uncharacterized zinc-type alcohol dehydrogenase-like protein